MSRRGGRPRSTGGPKMCTHEDHDALWPELPRLQSEDSFYSHTTKCKKCYIYLQTERVRRARQGLGPSPRAGGRRARGEATGPQQQALMLEQYQAALAKQRPSKRRALPAAAAAAGEDPAVEALLGAPVVHVPPAASPEDAAALRGAAVAAAWGAAILDEVRELSPAGTELPEQSASLSLLLASLRSALARAAGRAAPREAAQLAGVWRLAEARLAQAAAATRAAAAEAPALGGGCPCGRSYEYQSNAGPPVLCQGCARVYHAACAGSPDEAFTCPECQSGAVAVVRHDEARADFFVMEPAGEGGGGAGPPPPAEQEEEEEEEEARSLGHVLWAASRNHRLETALLKQRADRRP